MVRVHSLAATEFALGLALHGRGEGDRAAERFKEAHRLDPEDWTYFRQALSLAGPDRERLYQPDQLTEMRRAGAPPLYQPLDL